MDGTQKAYKLIQYIANDIPELSQEKIVNQRDDYKKQAKDWLNTYWQLIQEETTAIPVELPVILQGELLPCPFCGEDEWEKLGETYFLQHNYDCFIRNTSKPLISKTILRNNTESIWWNKRAGREPQLK